MKPRPVNLALHTMSFPIMAISSILHRISGVVIALLLPVMLCLLHYSLKSEKDFIAIKQSMNGFALKVTVWIFLCALTYHLFAGIRHIFMDLGFGESKAASKHSAMLVIGAAVISFIFLGGWLW